MSRLPRIRRTLKWACTLASIALAAVTPASTRIGASSGIILGSHAFRFAFEDGLFIATDIDKTDWTLSGRESKVPIDDFLRTQLQTVTPQHTLVWWPAPILETGGRVSRWNLRLPAWLPLSALLIVTLYLWRADRRRPLPGHCRKCNYNLTGNTSGICPECGAPIPQNPPT